VGKVGSTTGVRNPIGTRFLFSSNATTSGIVNIGHGKAIFKGAAGPKDEDKYSLSTSVDVKSEWSFT
jgi:hypothetical protein